MISSQFVVEIEQESGNDESQFCISQVLTNTVSWSMTEWFENSLVVVSVFGVVQRVTRGKPSLRPEGIGLNPVLGTAEDCPWVYGNMCLFFVSSRDQSRNIRKGIDLRPQEYNDHLHSHQEIHEVAVPQPEGKLAVSLRYKP